MKQRKRQSKGKEIRPTFFVFCEGETEEAYIKHLRSCYRLPIEIDAKITGNRITASYISNYKKQRTTHPKDETFLIYDGDIENVVSRLRKIKNADLLLSNPCFELWYLLHCMNQTASLSSEECVTKLKSHIKKYIKGNLNADLKGKLTENKTKATKRAKSLSYGQNPSTLIYRLVEKLDEKNRG
jgi:hypothetical protein